MEGFQCQQTVALARVTKQRNNLARLMMSRHNEGQVSTGLSDLNELFIKYQEAHEALCDAINEDDDLLTTETTRYRVHEADIAAFVQSCTEWADNGERFTSVSASSTDSTRSSRAREKAHLAALMAERELLPRKQALEAERQAFDLDLEIAKARAKEQVYDEYCTDGDDNLADNLSDTTDARNVHAHGPTTLSGATVPYARADPPLAPSAPPTFESTPANDDDNAALAALALVAMAATLLPQRAHPDFAAATPNDVANVTLSHADVPAPSAVSAALSDKATHSELKV